MKARGAESHLRAILKNKKPSRWLKTFLNSGQYMTCVETYLEDEEQLDLVVKYLQRVYQETGSRALTRANGDRVRFILDVLLPEVSGRQGILRMRGWGSCHGAGGGLALGCHPPRFCREALAAWSPVLPNYSWAVVQGRLCQCRRRHRRNELRASCLCAGSDCSGKGSLVFPLCMLAGLGLGCVQHMWLLGYGQVQRALRGAGETSNVYKSKIAS